MLLAGIQQLAKPNNLVPNDGGYYQSIQIPGFWILVLA